MQNSTQWQMLPKTPFIKNNCIDIVQTNLLVNSEQQAILYLLLNQEEKLRAERFHFAKHRRRFIAARGYLRHILSKYLLIEAKLIEFSYSSYGKPGLLAKQNSLDLRFNISHSEEFAIYAITQGNEVGIDIEQARDRNVLGIAERFFSPLEQKQLKQLSSEKQFSAFFHIWAQKEAIIKAVGQGLSYPLDKFSVNARKPARLLTIEGDDTSQWFLKDFFVADDFASALAIKQKINQINYFIDQI